ncbi:MAG: hypothetical protein ACKO85_04725 [Isosphaeraceae bacterium]
MTELEEQAAETPPAWVPPERYFYYDAASGFMLGVFGSVVSLMFNVIGSVIAGLDPLQLIRVYLTFPLGQQALNLAEAGGTTKSVPDGLILALGCSLYLGTGMLLGVPVFLVVNTLAKNKGAVQRVIVAVMVSLAVWAFNFYAILSWLQPAFFGGNWITSGEYLPWWVAAATHAVFGATIAILAPLGQFSRDRK